MSERKLRRYQERAIQAFVTWMEKPGSDLATIILPTGTGKTFTAVSAIKQYIDNGKPIKVLWVAHRRELIEQAYNEFKTIIPDANVQIEMASNRATQDADIVVGSVQTLHRNRKNIKGFNPNLVVIDEWHHYDEKNKTYHGIRERYDKAKLLGLTATPYRFIGGDLPLGETLIEMDIGTAVLHKYLTPPKPTILKTNVSLAKVNSRAGDFAIDQLSKTINVTERNEQIVKRIIQAVKEEKRQGIVYAADVAHSKAMCELAKKELRVGEVYGETDDDERYELVQRVRNGEIDVIFNNLVATEGWDLPHLSFVCIARPTKSLGLFIQMMGRGLRLSPGKTDCLVIDVFDKVKVTQSRITYSDVAAAGDIDGSRRRADAVLKEEIADKLENFPVVLQLSENGRWTIDEETWFAPSWMLSDNQWVVTWSKKEERTATDELQYVPLKYPPSTSSLKYRPIDVKHRFWGMGTANECDGKQVTVNFGRFGIKKIHFSELTKEEYIYEKKKLDNPIKRVLFICMHPKNDIGRMISLQQDGKNFTVIDDVTADRVTIDEMIKVTAEQDNIVPIVKSDAKWRKKPISEKQTAVLKRYINNGKISDDLDFDSMTAGDAAVIMDQVTWHNHINKLFGTDKQEKLIGYNLERDDV